MKYFAKFKSNKLVFLNLDQYFPHFHFNAIVMKHAIYHSSKEIFYTNTTVTIY